MVTVKEANDLETLHITTLFGELEEHDQELVSLDKDERNLMKT